MHAQMDVFPINGDKMPDTKIITCKEHFALHLDSYHAEYSIHVKTIDEILDLGYAIVNAVNEIKKTQRRAVAESMNADQIANLAEEVDGMARSMIAASPQPQHVDMERIETTVLD